jgi:hypothetical protein
MTNTYRDGSIRFTTRTMSSRNYVKQLRALACREFCRHCGRPKIEHEGGHDQAYNNHGACPTTKNLAASVKTMFA